MASTFAPNAYTCSLPLKSSSGQRRLLQQPPGATMLAGQEQLWQGYAVSVDAAYSAWGLSLAVSAPERARYAGVKGNRVIGGLFLHSTRKLSNPNCNEGSFAARFSMQCVRAMKSSVKSSSLADYIQALYAGALVIWVCDMPAGFDIDGIQAWQ